MPGLSLPADASEPTNHGVRDTSLAGVDWAGLPGPPVILRARLALIRSVPLGVFAGVLLIALALMPPADYGVDGESMLETSRSLAFNGSFAVPCDSGLGLPGSGGSCFSQWYPLLSIALVPFVLVGRVAASLGGVPTAAGEELVALALPAFATAGAAAFTAALAVELGADRRRAVFAAVALVFGTEVLTYTRTLFAEPLGALCVAAAVWGLLGRTRGRLAIGMVAVVLAILAKPQLVLVGPGIGLALALRDRSLWPLVRAGIATLAGGLLYLAYNKLRFSTGTDFGDSSRQISGDRLAPLALLEGVGVLTISPREGVFLFSPVLVVGAWSLWLHRGHRLAAACLGGALGILAFYMTNPYSGGWASRFLVPALPLLCVGLGVLRPRAMRVAMALTVVGFLIQLPTVVAYYDRYHREVAIRVSAERAAGHSSATLTWNFAESQIVRMWPVAVDELRDAARTDPRALVEDPDEQGPNDSLLKTVALWWWLLPVAGIPWVLGLLLSLVVIAAGVLVLVRAARGPPVTQP